MSTSEIRHLATVADTRGILTAEKYVKRSWSKAAPETTHILSIYSGLCCERAMLQSAEDSCIIQKQILLSDHVNANLIEHFPGKYIILLRVVLEED